MDIERFNFQGMELLRLRAAPYEAWITPEMGGNAIRLFHAGLEMEALRVPTSPGILRKHPNEFGMPPLFPPNRIRAGAFTLDGREYQFPVNEPARGNSLHGALSALAFRVEDEEESPSGAKVTLSFAANEAYAYMNFPHAFACWVTYELNTKGLTQVIRFQNRSESRMPFGFGFHTAFAIPRERAEDYRIHVPVETRWQLDPASALPTGETTISSSMHERLNGMGLPPLSQAVSSFFRRLPGPARIQDIARGTEVRYDVDDGFRFWMLWNARAEQDFICIEPMTWLVDAPNSMLSWAESGMEAIESGETKTLATQLSISTIG